MLTNSVELQMTSINVFGNKFLLAHYGMVIIYAIYMLSSLPITTATGTCTVFIQV